MAHCNTIPSQPLKFVPRHEFETLAQQTIQAAPLEQPPVGRISYH
jgi:hypothetical protein